MGVLIASCGVVGLVAMHASEINFLDNETGGDGSAAECGARVWRRRRRRRAAPLPLAASAAAADEEHRD